MKLYKIDDDGFLIFGEDIPDFQGEEIPEGYTSVYLDTIERGYHKPRLVEDVWVEGATQEEIDKITNIPVEPSEQDELLNYVLDLDMRLVMIEMGLI